MTEGEVGAGCGGLRALHTESTLAGQLQLKWVWAGVAPGLFMWKVP